MKYCAFISYNRADAAESEWLLRQLDAYRVPKRLVGTRGAYGLIQRRLGTFFRDREELAAGDDLGSAIRAALAESEALIVICSPTAARSRWVNAEIEAYQQLGRQERVLGFVVAGIPGTADVPDNCFPQALIGRDPQGNIREPMAADARPEGDGRNRAFTKLVAGLLGVDHDMLARREAQRRVRRITAVAVLSLIGMVAALGLAATAYVARDDATRRQAQAEDIMSFMVDDLRRKLTAVGRLDLMRSVDDKATAYYATLHPRDLTEGVLEQQARLLIGIGEVRTKEGHQDAALSAFREAHERSKTLYDRDPGNGRRLFDLAQAEYWIGWVAFQQARYDEAGLWLGKYRDSAIRLAAMDRHNLDWQMEAAYGYQNLAVLDEKLGRYASAEHAVQEQLALYRRWLVERPNDLALRYQASNAASWLGSLALRLGALRIAEDHFTEMVEGLKLNIMAEPANTQWQDDIVQGYILLADAQEQLGERSQARGSIDNANAIASALASHDPANNEWRLALATSVWRQATLAHTPAEATERAGAALKLLDSVQRVQPNSEYVARHMAGVWNTETRLALARGHSHDARDAVAKAIAAVEPLWDSTHSEDLRMLLAQSSLLSGDASELDHDRESARAAWMRTRDLLQEAHGRSEPLPFTRLACLVAALYRLGDAAAAQPYRKRLETAGFVPTEPFPAPAAL